MMELDESPETDMILRPSDGGVISMVLNETNEVKLEANANTDIISISRKTDMGEEIKTDKNSNDNERKIKKKKRDRQKCSAINCQNSRSTKSNISFFRFPKDEVRCREWVINCRRQDLLDKSADDLYKLKILCSEHFEDSQFVGGNQRGKKQKGRRVIQSSAIPTLFNFDVPASPVQLDRDGHSIHVKKTEKLNQSSVEAELIHRSDGVVISMVLNETNEVNLEANADTDIISNSSTNNVGGVEIKTEISNDNEQNNEKRKRQKHHVQWCSAINCKNNRYNRPDLSFHRFPRDEVRCRKWVVNCRRQDLLNKSAPALYSSNVLCSEHFEDSQFAGGDRRRINLKEARLICLRAIPTLFNFDFSASSDTDKLDKDGCSRDEKKQQISTKKVVPIYPAWYPEPPATAPDVSQETQDDNGDQDDIQSIGSDKDHQRSFLDDLTFSLKDFERLCDEYTRISHEVQRLRKKVEEVKHAARINLDLLTLTLVDVSKDIQCGEEMDKVSKLINLILNEDDEKKDYEDNTDFQTSGIAFDATTATSTIKKVTDTWQSSNMEDDNNYGNETDEDTGFTTDPAIDVSQDGLNSDIQQKLMCRGCGEEFGSLLELNFHQKHYHPESESSSVMCDKERRKKKSVNCKECGENFKTFGELRTHRKHSHPVHTERVFRFSCNFCAKQFFYKKSLDRHERIHTTREKTVQCSECDKLFWDKNCMRQHYRYAHSGLQRDRNRNGGVCDQCGGTFKTQGGLNHHIKMKSCIRFNCSECSETFLYVGHLEKHMTEFHPNAQCELNKKESESSGVMCDKCGCIFENEYRVKKHKCRKLNRCLECSKVFLFVKNLDRHMALYHPTVKPHKCTQCNKEYSSLRQLKNHMGQGHGQSVVVQCELCGRACSKQNFFRHMKLHKGKYPHRCRFCCMGFAEKDELGHHMEMCKKKDKPAKKPWTRRAIKNIPSDGNEVKRKRVGFGDKMFTCFKCDKQYRLFALLENHIDNTHEEETKSHVCTTCNRAFYLAEHVQEHLKRAHGPKVCNICGKVLANISSLAVHKKMHLGVKAFSCNVCGKSFLQKNQMESHMWTHRDEKRYYCQHCGRGFNDKRHLVSHVARCPNNPVVVR